MFTKPLKTMIRFTNGSCIEAFPNNPDTIRGPTLQIVYCDEMNFIRDDEELYDSCLFTLSSVQDGKFVCSSTHGTLIAFFTRFLTIKTTKILLRAMLPGVKLRNRMDP
jgi:phage terminase large subunit-like protein